MLGGATTLLLLKATLGIALLARKVAAAPELPEWKDVEATALVEEKLVTGGLTRAD